jgi:uncharacterized membrane protein YdbT with pleckstrin-like domain
MPNRRNTPPWVQAIVQRVLRLQLYLFGGVITLGFLAQFHEPLVLWIFGIAAVAFLVWLVVTIVRWRRSRW